MVLEPPVFVGRSFIFNFCMSYQRSSIRRCRANLWEFLSILVLRQSDLVNDHVGLRGVFLGGACHLNDCIGTVSRLV